MKVGVACVMQESNSFAALPSSLADFGIQEGPDLIAVSRNTNTEVGGFLAELASLGAEAVPLISAWAISGGPVDDPSFESLANLLLEHIRSSEFDGLLLALHGAWSSTSHPSADAELVRRVRKEIGETIPIVITLDLHANVGPPLLTGIQGLVGYRTYPHVDMADTGRAAARMIHRILKERLRPELYWMPIPLIAPPQSATTDRTPMKDVFDLMGSEFGFADVLSTSFFCVQPWLDMDGVASSLVVVASRPDAEIPSTMRKIGQYLWDHRNELQMEWVSPDDLVRTVMQETYRPVIVSEAFDAPTGGSFGDHPGLLSILLPHKEALSGCLFMVDAEGAAKTHSVGLGARFSGALGAKKDKRFGLPVSVEGKVVHLSDGGFILKGPVFTGKKVEMGPAAVLEIGRLKVLLASRPALVIDPELYRSQGIEPQEQDVIGIKSPTLFRPGYASMLGCVLHLDMPGVCRGNLAKVPFKKLGRPIWPLDDFAWVASRQPIFPVEKG
jgi:microcystin degradation protein MlrC